MKDRIYVKEVIIGVLVLIILTLILLLLNSEVLVLPKWFFGNLFLGLFTLAGAYFGAAIAGKSTLAATEKQLAYQKAEWMRIEKEKTLKIESSLFRHIKSLNKCVERIEFFIQENVKSYLVSRRLEMKTELEKELIFLMKKGVDLDNLSPEYLPPHIFKIKQEIMFYIETVNQDLALFLDGAGDKELQAGNIGSNLLGLKSNIAIMKSKINR